MEDEAYYERPISLRLPFVFYEGHLPVFSFNTLVKRGLGQPGIDARFEDLFARGIDPDESSSGAPSFGN
jgi:iron(II)-dependent oxidoreductase